ncbi:MAG: hypothetical protein JST54_12475 [Deltaproteobacteria bacterium]|nr:hypothetical protein [Deltaproteobacteria bacterium]
MADTTAVAPPDPTSVLKQPGTWMGLATVVAMLLAKYGLHIDPNALVSIGLVAAPVILGLFHHTATTDSAAIAHNAQVTAATIQAAASANAGTATDALKKAEAQ